MRYTRASVPDDQLYLASTAVVMSEVIKGLACVALLHFSGPLHQRTWQRLTSLLHRELISNWRETAKLAVPATLYLIQNNLQYVAATNLDAATFQVTYQLKILTTAFFSVVILKRTLVRLKWIALGLLTFGIALVVLPRDASAAAMAYLTGNYQDNLEEATIDTSNLGNQSNAKGFFAVLMACILSGLAGVYFEKILKAPATKPMPEMVNTLDHGEPDDEEGGIGLRDIHGRREDVMQQTQQQNQLWIRNLQMSFFSILLGLVFVVMLQDGATIVQKGFFVNYNSLTWLVIAIQAFGGLVVALVVKYADNILKGFATSISIILSSLVSVWLFNFTLSGTFIFGTALVIYATYLYGL
ncbi:UDP-galactose transporter [Halteromyces radiatus]|uniref:UDP-galactose transporter n=1 Tax=Halteromyces radiatus TaxID=101107 RepID=UPI00221F961F|nr:UDP-galactose transporter [Halteromyces radiatus]KAI8081562.1 UDP-galactose transporter [Halteromyces radiatus]